MLTFHENFTKIHQLKNHPVKNGLTIDTENDYKFKGRHNGRQSMINKKIIIEVFP